MSFDIQIITHLMEEKIPPEESCVWTLSDFIERRKNWDQGDETQLAKYLQHLSNKINQGAKNTLNELNELVASVDDTVVKAANINNEFQLLADKQFIENKVQEEDETVQTSIEKPVEPKTNDPDLLVNNLKEALKNSFKAIDAHFEKVTVIVSDSDDDDDESKHEEIVLRPRTFYKKLNLPLLSGDTQPEIDLDCIMSSETDSDVEQPVDMYKDEESLSNDVPVKHDISYCPSESKVIHDSTPAVTENIMFEPETFHNTSSASFVGNVEDDLFSPPPLLNDNDEDDLDNEYNLFGNSNSNVYGEKNFWNDDNDDEEDFLNQPPLPIHSDEPPQLVIESKPQEKAEAPSIQQSLNDELRKRFKKDNSSPSSDNVNLESPSKIKVPKGAVNILGGTDTNPYIPVPAQNIKQPTLSWMNKKVSETKQDSNSDNANGNISDKLVDNSSPIPRMITAHNDLIKEINSIKKQPEQGSDDEDLFSKNTLNVTASTIEVPKYKDSLADKAKLSRTIFSESDSDEDFMSSKSKNNKTSFKPTIEDNRNKHLDSSSDDDLFSNKSILKEKPVLVSSKIQDEYIKKNENISVIKQKPKSLDEENSMKKEKNKEVFDELKRKLEGSCVIANKSVVKNEFSPSSNILNTSYLESSSIDNLATQSNQKSLNSQHTKTYNNLFSSDEDELDDNAFFNVNESNKNCVEKGELVSTNLIKNITSEVSVSKLDNMFDSSSDDDIFNVNKSNNNLVSSKNIQQSNNNKLKNDELKQNDNQKINNQIQKSENSAEINPTEKNTSDKKTTSIFSLLTDDEDDDDLSFNNITYNSKNSSSFQKIKESSPSKKLLNSAKDSKNNDIIQKSPPEDLIDNGSEINLPKNESLVIFEESSALSDELTFLNKNDEIKFQEETKVISLPSNVLSENCLDSEEQKSLNNKETSITKNENLNNSNESSIQANKSPSSLLGGIEQEPSVIKNEDSKSGQTLVINKISESSLKSINPNNSLKDSVDGLSFSSPNSISETPTKIPGKLNKNAGAFINIKGLLPNSKSSPKTLNTPLADSLNENNNDNLPTSGTKLFSAEKERARIQVKRRPPSRKARQAARTSYVDIGHESNLQDSSRLFNSTSDLVDYQSSPILNDNVTDSSNEVQNKTKVPSTSLLFVTNVKNDEKLVLNNEAKTNILNLFDDDSDPFESSQEEEKYRNNSKKKSLDDKQSEFEVVDKQISEIKPIDKIQSDIESGNNKPEVDSIQETISNVKSVNENQVIDTKKANKLKSNIVTQNTELSKKSVSLFDDDDDDGDLFTPKSGKGIVSSSNIFDSDEELEFGKNFTKKNLASTKSIFGDDDSDEDLFSTPSKPSTSSLHSQKPIGSSHLQNRSVTDRCVKLAAESVAINPLESKND